MAWYDDVKDEIDNAADSAKDAFKSVNDYLINPFYAATSDLISYGFEKLAEYLAPDPDYNNRVVNSRGPTTPRRVIYGKAKVGGQVAFIESTGADNRKLHVVLLLADHYCQSIGDVYIQDKLSTDSQFDGKLSVYKSSNGVLPSALTNYLSSRGYSNYKYTNQTLVYCVFDYDDEVYRGIPQVSCVVTGKNDIYDPRTGTTGYSNNAALCELDWVRNYIGAPDDDIHMPSWETAADVCDELVAAANGGTEKRYTLNGTILRQGSRIESLAKMAGNSGVSPTFRNGRWGATPEVYVAPAANAIIDPSLALSAIDVSTGAGKQDKVNTIKGTYIDATREFEKIEYPSIQTPTYLEEDKEVLEQTIDYQMVNSGTQCRRLAKILLEKSRRGVTVQGSFKYRVLEYEVGDRVKFNFDAFGWTEKVFQVTEREIDSVAGVRLTLREDAPEIYAWEEGDALESPIPPLLGLPDPNFVDVPTLFSITESLYRANTQKAIKARATFEWVTGDTSTRSYEIQGSYEGGPYRIFSDFVVGNEFKFDDLEIGDWLFRIRGVNAIGVKSDWVTLPFTILGKTAPPSDVIGFTGVVKPFGIELTWEPSPDIDVAEYEVRLGSDWDTATRLQRLDALSWQWETRASGTEQVLIKAIDTTGNYSLNATPADIVVNPPKAPSPVNAQIIDNFAILTWLDATTSFAIDRYEIRKGVTFESGDTIRTTNGTGDTIFETERGTYTYWVQGIDIAGNRGEAASVTANLDSPSDFVLQSDQALSFADGTKTNLITDISEAITFDDDSITMDNTDITFDDGPTTVLIGPADTTETWDEHFRKLPNFIQPITMDDDTITFDDTDYTFDEGYQSIQQLQIDNGYPLYLQPTPASAQYEQVIDFLGEFTISRIQLTPDFEIIEGMPTIAFSIGYSQDGVTYTTFADTTEVVGKAFRYVKVIIDITSSSDLDLIQTTRLRLRLDVKLRTDQGRVEITSTGGTTIPFNIEFVDIQSITCTPKGTGNRSAVYDFDDLPNPTDFTAYVFEDGVETTGEISWVARGV